MKKQLITEAEKRRMQALAGIIKEDRETQSNSFSNNEDLYNFLDSNKKEFAKWCLSDDTFAHYYLPQTILTALKNEIIWENIGEEAHKKLEAELDDIEQEKMSFSDLEQNIQNELILLLSYSGLINQGDEVDSENDEFGIYWNTLEAGWEDSDQITVVYNFKGESEESYIDYYTANFKGKVFYFSNYEDW